MAKIPTRSLGDGLVVGSQGLGCMGMSLGYTTGQGSEDDYIKIIHRAVEAGCMLDTSDVYGPFTNEVLIGKALATIPRESVILATKFGVLITPDWKMTLDGSRKHAREACEASLKRLDTDYIDLYYQHRMDPTVPIEETMAELKLLVEEGKIRHIGLSEASPDEIRRAHAIHPIAAIQLEWSLWSRSVEEDVVPLCRELGIGIVSYSPLGRGFLTGQIKSVDDLAQDDWRRTLPRFQKEALEKNLELVRGIEKLAEAKGTTPGQLALAWVLAQGKDVVPIPGTKRMTYFEQNLAAGDLELSAEEVAHLTALSDAADVVGGRYAEADLKHAHGD